MNVRAMKAEVAKAIESHQDEIIEVAEHICRNPEPGYTEVKTAKFVREKLEGLGIDLETGLAITGMKGSLAGGAGPGPSVALVGELDSLRVYDHPLADPETGAAHACGHHCQVGSMYGALTGLVRSGVLDHLWGRVVAIAVPAEEFIDVQDRLALRDSGAIEFLGGKQEFLKLGVLDDVDMAMLVHTAPEGVMPNRAALAVGGTSNAHVAKFVEYTGFGAHAAAAPHKGVNALNAAMIGLAAIHANRETFEEKDKVRVHGILTRGGEAVSAIPPKVVLEWRVRAGSPEAVVHYAEKVDRGFKAGALAVGARVDITDIPWIPTDAEQSDDAGSVRRERERRRRQRTGAHLAGRIQSGWVNRHGRCVPGHPGSASLLRRCDRHAPRQRLHRARLPPGGHQSGRRDGDDGHRPAVSRSSERQEGDR